MTMQDTQGTVTVYPYASLGAADHGWLKARHHFSFAMYHNPKRMGFGTLRVINDDRVAAGRGFDTHPHRDMEIITYVRSGAISHRDSVGNEGRTGAGDVQVMSAGRGVYHSEFNHEDVDTTLYQIWIEPNILAVQPRWDAAQFPKAPVTGRLPVLVSGRAEDEASGALFIHQDAAISGGRIEAGTVLHQPVKHQAYLLVSAGEIDVMDQTMKKGDGAEVVGIHELVILAKESAEILVIDVPEV